MLILWTTAPPATIKSVIGGVIESHVIAHKFISEVDAIPICSPGDVLVAMGSKTLAVLQSLGVLPKGRTVTSLREKPVMYNGFNILVTFDPGVVSRDYARLPEIQWDIHLAIRLHKTGTTAPHLGIYTLVESYHTIIKSIVTKYDERGKAIPVACDLESTGLDEYREGAYIISLSFTIKAGESQVAYFRKDEYPVRPNPNKIPYEYTYWEKLWIQIHWLLTDSRVVIRGANFKFDSRWINHHWGILCTNQKFDTMLVGSLLDENRSNSLKLHAKIFTDMGGYDDPMKKYDMGNMQVVPVEEIVIYNGGDTDATYRVADVQRKYLLGDKLLTNFYTKLVQPAAKVFEKMERNGITIDVPYYLRLQEELKVETSRLHTDMINLIPAALKFKYKDNLSITRAALLIDFLFTKQGLNLKPKMLTAKTGAASTSIEHLLMFEDNPRAMEFVGILKEYGSATKTLSTYVVGFLKHLRSDGKFHPTYHLARGGYSNKGNDDAGTVTGRTSASDPAVQTISKHTKWAKPLRRTIIAPPGYRILNCDYSQGELRIAAVVAKEPTMIQAYRDNKDLHAITAAQINGYTIEDFMALEEDVRDALRSGGKAGNFGLLYGMMHVGFQTYAKTSYGVIMSDEEAFRAREAFFELYKRLGPWHEECKGIAKMYGSIRSPLGRIRHLPLIRSSDAEARACAERQSINSPIQATLSDLMQLAMVAIDEQYGHCDIQMFLMTHDSLSLLVPEAEAEEWAQRVKSVMENLPLKEDFGWDSPLVFIADAELSYAGEDGIHSLAGLKKVKGLY